MTSRFCTIDPIPSRNSLLPRQNWGYESRPAPADDNVQVLPSTCEGARHDPCGRDSLRHVESVNGHIFPVAIQLIRIYARPIGGGTIMPLAASDESLFFVVLLRDGVLAKSAVGQQAFRDK